jgi:Na+-transporting methylmalonyl-CoA/oxaloacetate decarboxylase gamma subunit
MFNAINTKLLLAILAVLVSIASYFAHQKNKEDVAAKKAHEMRRQVTPEEQKALPQNWSKSAKEYRSK